MATMTTGTITPEALHERIKRGERVELIDVRTPAEYREVHAEPARLVPLDELEPSTFRERGNEPLYFICRSGSRGKKACEKLRAGGFEQAVNVEGGTLAWAEQGLPVVRGKKTISLERQVRIAAGTLVLIGAGLSLVHPAFVGIAAFVGAGLVFAGITDTCGMGMLLARMPWNKVRCESSSCTELIGWLPLLASGSPGLGDGSPAGLAIAFGAIVGLALGLTGGGGSIFAVPMLVYGLGVPVAEAPPISLAVVGATAAFGAGRRFASGEVDLRAGLLFSVGGVVGEPAGSALRGAIPAPALMLLFAALMLVVAARMWSKAGGRSPRADRPESAARVAPLAVAGVATGFLAGLFGVGGGFVIVPALVFFGGLGIHRAVATSLLAIALIAAWSVARNLVAGRPLPLELAGLFLVGGVAGMLVGTRIGRRLPAARLQRIFAAAILAVAALVVIKTLAG